MNTDKQQSATPAEATQPTPPELGAAPGSVPSVGDELNWFFNDPYGPNCGPRTHQLVCLLRDALEEARKDTERLDWLLGLIQARGTDYLMEMIWTNPADNDPMEEDDQILDRYAIDADKARAQNDCVSDGANNPKP